MEIYLKTKRVRLNPSFCHRKSIRLNVGDHYLYLKLKSSCKRLKSIPKLIAKARAEDTMQAYEIYLAESKK